MDNKKNIFSPFSTVLVFVAFIIIGASMIPLLNIQLNPSRSVPSVSVEYYWRGASARIIEQEVTARLESMFSVMSGLKDISSVSAEGQGTIDMLFKKSINPDVVRFEIATIIRRIYPQLPAGVSYPSISLGRGGNKKVTVLIYTLTSGAEPFYIKQYAEDNIVPKISVIPGVNEVNVYGAMPYKYEIIFDLAKSRILGITGNDIEEAVNNYFGKHLMGTISYDTENSEDTREFRVSYQTTAKQSPDWNNIPVKNVNGRIVYLSDLARVGYKEKSPDSYFRINGLNTINMVVYAEAGVNNIRLADKVKSEVQRIKPQFPKGYSIIPVYDATEYLHDELVKIGFRTLYSLLILMVFVLIISRKMRYLFFIAASLSANLIIAVIFYYLLHLEIHLYSLAGITVSFGIIIDNSIVMIDHYRHRKNRRAFIAILAATLTTIGSLCVVFFLKEEQQLNLVDFTWVMIVNLGISMLIALLFIPSMLDLAPLKTIRNRVFFRRKRRVVKTGKIYIGVIRFTKQRKWIFIILLILGFGLPIHWLPQKIETEKENGWSTLYNKTLGGRAYQDFRPVAEKILGGSLRLFSQHVYERSFYAEPERTRLFVRGVMPEGCTVQQLNEAIKKMENYLSSFDEIEMYRTSVYSYNNSEIVVNFKPDFENGSFPFYLKGALTTKAISLGGLDWNIYGVGQGFSNALHSGFKYNQIEIRGYDYEQLYKYAVMLSDSLSKNPRVKDMEISGSNGWNAQTLHEFVIDFDREALTLQGLTLLDYYNYLRDETYSRDLMPVFNNGEKTPVTLSSDASLSFNKWKLNNEPVTIAESVSKFHSIGSIVKRKTGNVICKDNQEYRLYLMFDYIGPYQMANKLTRNSIESINHRLPMGYKASPAGYWSWDRNDKKQYYLIFLVVAIIFFLCAILLESLLQPLAIIAMIPVSFIGVFLTFYLFGLNFDQGGFASFVLLCGLSVNSALYIVNDYNIFRKVNSCKDPLRNYLKAFNHKIIPVVLTVLSTVIGLVPFILGGQKEVFWFAFAAGTIGGLIFSMVALLLYFPLFLSLKK